MAILPASSQLASLLRYVSSKLTSSVDVRYVGTTAVSSADCCFGVPQWRRYVVYRLEWIGGTTPPYLPQTASYDMYTCLTVTNWTEITSTWGSYITIVIHICNAHL